MQILRFAAVDIGSNAVRLLFTYVIISGEVVQFKKYSLVRIPLRLGMEVFGSGSISKESTKRLTDILHSFRHLCEAHQVTAWDACATSAMRESTNGREVAATVQNETGIGIRIIDGSTEAEIILANHFEQALKPGRAYLYVDVGGGSTEVSLIHKGGVLASRSFRLGTLRYAEGRFDAADWNEMLQWTQDLVAARKTRIFSILGSGGNINTIYKRRRGNSKYLRFAELEKFYNELLALTYEERVQLMLLKPDRADVIVPATEIYMGLMRSTGIDKIFVPGGGLSDGMIRQLYVEWCKSAGVEAISPV